VPVLSEAEMAAAPAETTVTPTDAAPITQAEAALSAALEPPPIDESDASAEAGEGIAPKEIVLALASEDAGLRSAAQRILSALYPDWARSSVKRQIIVPLLAGLRDERFTVRASAARTLGKLGEPATVPALKQALHDCRSQVRRAAEEALEEIEEALNAPRSKKPRSRARSS
jgi:HEAT repeat protein